MNEQAPPKISSQAVWSLILGILGIFLFCIPLVLSIPAVICGHKSLSRIKRSAGTLSGDGLAIAGLVTGYLGLAMSVFALPLLLAIAIPNFVRARSVAQMNLCINQLQQIDSAKQQWALDNKKEATDVPTQSDLAPYLKRGMPKCPAEGIYTLNAVGEKPACSILGHQLPGNSAN